MRTRTFTLALLLMGTTSTWAHPGHDVLSAGPAHALSAHGLALPILLALIALGIARLVSQPKRRRPSASHLRP